LRYANVAEQLLSDELEWLHGSGVVDGAFDVCRRRRRRDSKTIDLKPYHFSGNDKLAQAMPATAIRSVVAVVGPGMDAEATASGKLHADWFFGRVARTRPP
jgi:hypothetical protein